jgi:hypothetical protein
VDQGEIDDPFTDFGPIGAEGTADGSLPEGAGGVGDAARGSGAAGVVGDPSAPGEPVDQGEVDPADPNAPVDQGEVDGPGFTAGEAAETPVVDAGEIETEDHGDPDGPIDMGEVDDPPPQPVDLGEVDGPDPIDAGEVDDVLGSGSIDAFGSEPDPAPAPTGAPAEDWGPGATGVVDDGSDGADAAAWSADPAPVEAAPAEDWGPGATGVAEDDSGGFDVPSIDAMDDDSGW